MFGVLVYGIALMIAGLGILIRLRRSLWPGAGWHRRTRRLWRRASHAHGPSASTRRVVPISPGVPLGSAMPTTAMGSAVPGMPATPRGSAVPLSPAVARMPFGAPVPVVPGWPDVAASAGMPASPAGIPASRAGIPAEPAGIPVSPAVGPVAPVPHRVLPAFDRVRDHDRVASREPGHASRYQVADPRGGATAGGPSTPSGPEWRERSHPRDDRHGFPDVDGRAYRGQGRRRHVVDGPEAWAGSPGPVGADAECWDRFDVGVAEGGRSPDSMVDGTPAPDGPRRAHGHRRDGGVMLDGEELSGAPVNRHRDWPERTPMAPLSRHLAPPLDRSEAVENAWAGRNLEQPLGRPGPADEPAMWRGPVNGAVPWNGGGHWDALDRHAAHLEPAPDRSPYGPSAAWAATVPPSMSESEPEPEGRVYSSRHRAD